MTGVVHHAPVDSSGRTGLCRTRPGSYSVKSETSTKWSWRRSINSLSMWKLIDLYEFTSLQKKHCVGQVLAEPKGRQNLLKAKNTYPGIKATWGKIIKLNNKFWQNVTKLSNVAMIFRQADWQYIDFPFALNVEWMFYKIFTKHCLLWHFESLWRHND